MPEKMFLIPEGFLRQVIGYLPTISVPAPVGVNIMEIVKLFNGLQEYIPEPPKETPNAD